VILGKLKTELARWGGAVRAQLDPGRPPVVGWQIPFVGCGISYGRSGPRWLEEQHARLGSPFTLYMMGERFTLSQDPEYMRRFYTAGVEDVSFFAGLEAFPGFRELIPLGGSGPEGANVGIEMLRQFLPTKVSSAAADLDEEAALSLKESLSSGRGDVLATCRAAIMGVTAVLLVGPRLGRDRAFLDAVSAFDAAVLRLARNPFDRGAVKQGLDARARSVERIIDELRRRREDAYAGEPRDLADTLLRARSAGGERFSDEVMALDLHGYMFATAANTPAGAAMCLMHVLADPSLRRRLVDEQETSRRAHGEVISPPALRDMPLLNACYQETLRLYAPGLHLRMALRPMQIGKYTLPERSMIAFSPYLLHRDPSVYTDPDVFDPERFLRGPRGPAEGPSASHYLPYGRGLHTCIGRNLARQEIMLTVARLLRDFDVSLEPCKDPLAVDWVTNGIAAPAGPRTLRARRRSS
jgi:cytochrome P450